MKKSLVILLTISMVSFGANAQLSNLLKGLTGQSSTSTEQSSTSTSSSSSEESSTLSSILSMATSILGNVTTSNYDFTGTWTYKGAAIALTSSNTLSQLAGSAAESTVEAKVDEYLSKVGIKSGALTFTFNADSTFSFTLLKIPFQGTWSYDKSTSAINLKFGKTMKWLSMTGIIKTTISGETKLLFTADKFLAFVKNLLEKANVSGSTAISTVTTLLNSYDGLYVGFKLAK